MTRRMVGLDLNGRADFAARDNAPDDPDRRGEPYTIDGGVAADIVLTSGGRRIAGPQAEIAPHGRGDGWGELGKPNYRRPTAGALDAPRDGVSQDDIDASVLALARGATDVILTVPDLPDFDETRQGALLDAAAGRRRRVGVRLLWRPVAAFLDLLAIGSIPAGEIGRRYRLLVHGAAGVEEQVLTLVKDPEHPTHVAPRRDGTGRLITPQLGLDSMFALARSLVREGNPGIAWHRCEPSRLGPRLICGMSTPGEVEVLRSWTGTWQAVTAPTIDPKAVVPGFRPEAEALPDVLPTFLVTPVSGNFAKELQKRLEPVYGSLTLVHARCIARGALRAGRLIERGLPHYFDCLERIALAVMRDREPVFADLIPHGHPVPANRAYVSPILEGFTWPARKDELQVYILKGSHEVRHWQMKKGPAPRRPMSIDLQVRQTPGQSWAQLTVASRAWDALSRAPIELDWETFRPINRTPDEILDELRNSPPPIPDRVVDDPHIDLWLGANWAGDGRPAQLARQVASGGRIGMADWANLLSQTRRHPDQDENPRYRLVGTDGSLPDDLPDDVRKGFARVLQGITRSLLSDKPQPNNDALRVASWSFVLCDPAVQDRIVAALEALAAGRSHPLLAPAHASRVVRQGAGRAVAGVERLRRVLKALGRSPLNNDGIAALAMIVARREEAPQALTRTLVDHFARELARHLLEQVRRQNFAVIFSNTLAALVGLFRWRDVESHALLADRDPVAGEIRRTLINAVAILEAAGDARAAALRTKMAQIRDIVAFLDGAGDPRILERLVTD